nr:NUDIX domain-containing protein [Microvirga tunisiensis]
MLNRRLDGSVSGPAQSLYPAWPCSCTGIAHPRQGSLTTNIRIRELLEETAVHAEARDVLTTLDVLVRDVGGNVRQHYILIAVQCRWISGEPVAGDDALEARWFPIAELDPDTLAMSVDVDVIARRAHVASNLGDP